MEETFEFVGDFTIRMGLPPGFEEEIARALLEDAERDRQLVEEWDATLPPLDDLASPDVA